MRHSDDSLWLNCKWMKENPQTQGASLLASFLKQHRQRSGIRDSLFCQELERMIHEMQPESHTAQLTCRLSACNIILVLHTPGWV